MLLLLNLLVVGGHPLLEVTRVYQVRAEMHGIETYCIEKGLGTLGGEHNAHTGFVVIAEVY